MDTFVSDASFFDNTLRSAAAETTKGGLYHSIHPGQYDPRLDITKAGDKVLGVKEKKVGATFGKPLGTLRPQPSGYTLKHAGEPQLPPPGPPTKPKTHLKPAVPSRDDVPPHGLVTAKNFIIANAVETILAEPKRVVGPPPATQKKEFGQVPKYLQKIKSKIAEEKEIVAAYVKQQEEANQTHRQMPESEKEDLIYDLKMKWENVNQTYQKLPLSCDTAGKRTRKETMEKELAQLEKSIKMLSRPVVMVEVNSGQYC